MIFCFCEFPHSDCVARLSMLQGQQATPMPMPSWRPANSYVYSAYASPPRGRNGAPAASARAVGDAASLGRAQCHMLPAFSCPATALLGREQSGVLVVGGVAPSRFVIYRGLCILPQQYWGEGNQAYKFVSVAEMAERFKASKHGLAIADHLAQPVQTSDIGGKHHGGENVRLCFSRIVP